jgi:hypothetical protein
MSTSWTTSGSCSISDIEKDNLSTIPPRESGGEYEQQRKKDNIISRCLICGGDGKPLELLATL